jgi:hypothetical protein
MESDLLSGDNVPIRPKKARLRGAKSSVLNDKVEPRYSILHIGKTGGTTLAALIKQAKKQDPSLSIQKVSHQWTLERCAAQRPNSLVGFVVREPTARFVSGFNSRLRSGRPAHERIWTPAEAVAFSYFPTANSLAEALYSSDERLFSASRFAMNAINHLRRGYRFHLNSIETLKANKDRIYCVRDLSSLSEDILDFLSPFSLDTTALIKNYQQQHVAPTRAPDLSEQSRENLHRFWVDEYSIYNYCVDNLVR